MPVFHVPKPGDRPDVEVLVDDHWWPGELRMWTQHDDGTWTAQVQWRRRPADTHIDTFPAERVRESEGYLHVSPASS